MREILFKAKRIDNGEWVEGMPCATSGSGIYAIQTMDSDIFHIDQTTICQYTGLTDKNGNKIWDNDVVRSGINLVVTWNEKFASWCITKKGWAYNHFFGEAVEPQDCEVIGNIFDNSELLGGAE